MEMGRNTARGIALLTALIVALLCAASANAATAHISYASLGDTEVGPAVTPDYVYWIELEHSKNRRSFTSTVFQRNIASGEQRVLFSDRNTTVPYLYADGGHVAFSTITIRTLNRRVRKNHNKRNVYAMAETDPAPTAIVGEENPSKLTIKVERVRGSKRTTTTYSECGVYPSLNDVSESGQIFVDEEVRPCSKSKKHSRRSLIFEPGVAMPSSHQIQGDVFFANLQYGKIVAMHSLDIQSTDLSTGARKLYKLHGLWSQGEYNAAGDFAAVGDTEIKNSGHFQSTIVIFRAGSNAPSAQINEDAGNLPSVFWCASGLVEITEPIKKPIQLILRALDGSVIKQVEGPRSGLGYDAKCVGNHLTLAAKADEGQPQIFHYDF